MLTIYIASKYTDITEEAKKENIKIAREWAVRLWDLGYAAISPVLNTALFEKVVKNVGYDDFMNGDFEILSRCDAVFLAPNWINSPGAKAEKAFAEKNHIFVTDDLDELHAYRNKIETITSDNKFRLILFTGFAQSGKSTASKILEENFEYTEKAFATKLKWEVQHLLFKNMPLLRDFLIKANNGDIESKTKIRSYLIAHGEVMRSIDPYYWIKSVTNEIMPNKNFVISDCRYLNEARAFKNLYGAILIRIHRKSEISTIPTEIVSLKEIEQSGLIDYHVDNNDTIENLKDTLEQIIMKG